LEFRTAGVSELEIGSPLNPDSEFRVVPASNECLNIGVGDPFGNGIRILDPAIIAKKARA
jgi:hypothetical protein